MQWAMYIFMEMMDFILIWVLGKWHCKPCRWKHGWGYLFYSCSNIRAAVGNNRCASEKEEGEFIRKFKNNPENRELVDQLIEDKSLAKWKLLFQTIS